MQFQLSFIIGVGHHSSETSAVAPKIHEHPYKSIFAVLASFAERIAHERKHILGVSGVDQAGPVRYVPTDCTALETWRS